MLTSTTDPWAAVVGQERAVDQLKASLAAPVHAYLLVGPTGSGKRALARAFSAELLARGSDGDDRERHVALAMSERHPDLHIFERKGPYITVEQAHEVVREAARTPIDAPGKVLLLIDFHLVERAAPALLKAIEEPTETTTFLVLAEHVPPPLLPIASRCVRVELGRVPDAAVAERLMAEGVDPDRATECAAAAGGNVDRARLLATDARLSLRREAWRVAPGRLDGSGSAVAAVVAELRAHIDDAQAPLDERHRRELAELDELEERYGRRRGSGRKTLVDRHKRETRRLRTDELRLGLATLASYYREQATVRARHRSVVGASDAIQWAAEALAHNPNEALLLQALFLKLSAI